jgi:hypothetical protein
MTTVFSQASPAAMSVKKATAANVALGIDTSPKKGGA